MSRLRVLGGAWLRTDHVAPLASFAGVLVAFLVVPGLDGQQVNSGAYYNTLQGFAPLGLVALGLGLTLIAGEFDVSVLGMQALGGVLAVRAGEHSGLVGVVAAVAACGFLGLLQGIAIARLRLPSLPVTIGTYIALLGLTNVIAANNTLTYGNIGSSVWVDQPILTWFSPRSLITLARFVSKRDVIGEWACHGGGGEALFGTNKSPDGPGAPVPLLRIRSNGSFRGSTRYGPSGHQGTVVATGGFSASGRTARIDFTLDPGPHSCMNGPLKLTAQ